MLFAAASQADEAFSRSASDFPSCAVQLQTWTTLALAQLKAPARIANSTAFVIVLIKTLPVTKCHPVSIGEIL
jgi:hypothetical protein